ncbi:4-alpha-glucanotransferase [Amnibacterium kyonggiense]|uniref:4-alpha-glucanotransferase n=1 Tax=Amnibacterium kyonggiense TaxID=595671 RepID=A0A4R7FRP7_9MICO|nr:4-alpha-glucanotransferase [Amnibacterium kyonggiense]TDS80490.1 4-alpha-glucanotransferase [Amnibacterium kyonggiense]
MTLPDQPLVDLAHAHRVSTSFTDWKGVTQAVSAETLTAVLRALGVDPADPAAALQDAWDAPWRRTLPACTTAVQGVDRLVWVHVPDGAPAALAVELELGGRRDLEQVDQWVEPREVDGRRVGEATFRIPGDLPLGYHRLVASSGDTTAAAPLVVTPARVGLPERMGDRRGWVLAAQLYSVRSAGSWGVGDLTDLTDLAVWAGADLGADSVLVNPLHAAEPVPPLEPSPYLPSSRRFFNPLYLRVEAVPEIAALPSRARARFAVLARRVRERASGDRIDRDAAWAAKREALRLLFAVPRSAGRELDLAAFRRREGVALTDFATWSVLAEVHGNDARTWPEDLRSPASPAVVAFAEEHAEEIDFTCWLQWLLDEQLAHAQEKALTTGMGVGVMHDLAVGVHPGGADAWRLGAAYARGVAVGAPPDPFNQLGQNWLQPPWRPDALEASAYAPFRDLIRAVLRHAGGVRVDHIIGLFRLWWVPEGQEADRGAYVYYDHEALIGVLALEAVRAQAVVVGEDLGVVDPSAREYFASRGILGTSILWFETADGGALPAERWREQCLASVTTHDLPPTAGYLEGAHVRLRAELGLLTRPVEEELEADRAEQRVWLDEVRSRGLLPEGADEEATVLALHRYLGLTPARLVSAALVDLVGDRRTQNQPGTLDEYPNWRVPLAGPDGVPMPLEDVFASTRAARLAAVLPHR